MSSQHDPAERFRLPDSFASVGDPVEGNPFPVDDPLHEVWIGATRKAEEEVCHLTSSALLNDAQCRSGLARDPHHRHVRRVGAAGRLRRVVRSRRAALRSVARRLRQCLAR